MTPEIQAFATGFPTSLLHAGLTLLILLVGAGIYILLTPHKEITLIREGNIAAAVSLGGVMVGLAIPLSVSLTASTSSGLQVVARGLEWRHGDEVVVPLGEFPSNLWPWKALQRLGVVLREVPLWDGHRAGAGAWDSTPATASGSGPEERLLAARFGDDYRAYGTRVGRWVGPL